MQYCDSPFYYKRRRTREIVIGDPAHGGADAQGRRTEVRQEQSVGAVGQAGCHGRLVLIDIQPCPGDPALLHAFAEERERMALPQPAEFPVRRELLIASDRGHALTEALRRSAKRYATYASWGLGHDLDATAGAFGADELRHAEEHFILGEPQSCAEQLARLRDEIGMTTFMFKPQWPGLEHRDAMRQLERFGTGRNAIPEAHALQAGADVVEVAILAPVDPGGRGAVVVQAPLRLEPGQHRHVVFGPWATEDDSDLGLSLHAIPPR